MSQSQDIITRPYLTAKTKQNKKANLVLIEEKEEKKKTFIDPSVGKFTTSTVTVNVNYKDHVLLHTQTPRPSTFHNNLALGPSGSSFRSSNGAGSDSVTPGGQRSACLLAAHKLHPDTRQWRACAVKSRRFIFLIHSIRLPNTGFTHRDTNAQRFIG